MIPFRAAKLPQYGALRVAAQAAARPCISPVRTLTLQYRRPVASAPANPQILSPTAQIQRLQGQARWYTPENQSSPPPPPPPPYTTQTKEPIWKTLGRLLSFSTIFRGQTFKKMFRDSPEETTLAVIILLASGGCVAYAVWMYFNYFYAEQFTKYPPDVAKSLRRALYYSNHGLDVNLAHKYYKLALEQCRDNHMDPFSDDVVGIKIQLSAWLEKMGNIPGAAKVLDLVLAENKKWLAMVEKTPEKLPMAPVPGMVLGEGENARTVTKEEFDLWVRSSRTRVLAKSCQMSVKLGTLCADDQILDNEKSHDHLIWATENALKEFYRRAKEGVKDGEGSWLGPQEIGGTLESLGQSFERREQYDLALPLFFQALRLCDDQCHLAVIMNNLAVAFSQHPPRAPYETIPDNFAGQFDQAPTPPAPGQTWTRKDHIEAAERWAKNALRHAKELKGDARTPECDQACAVALVNLGNIALLSGDHDAARRRFQRAIKVSEDNSFPDGIREAEEGLKRLSQ
ncbi:hypothetical protein BD289DRAFT_367921 [Coniella lustricola]|uniref:TPR domain-containing protein n=1 Tax=Coniella lustricola TaxID=2025994 RepID=A0A2T3A8X1_9PEZI|nr:hypothetical protein BD289DRAFT_367921 [Coniella lustricola]